MAGFRSSRGTSKPQALTVSIPQSEGKRSFEVERQREREIKDKRERERGTELN